MITFHHPRTGSVAAGALRRGAALALLAGAAFFIAGQAPALAQSTSWEEGCAMPVVTPGYGDALRVHNCARQKDCQQMADARGGMMMGMGCFFVAPRGTAPETSPAGRTRPAQRQ